ncbi:LysR family transcriptional regulator [Pseudobdellovibrio exovorus]|uniref:HTH lysR-type domain-containing protein n=1 Tax=Pseudobdellovibrio exovorus JSS TaxID=1184267 RepID=M4VN66_9BACT|nr:LysR family transcriptional regulator [Pseudobdellovibrio exovorus]AGH94514.1 hypothetical protein A11Q_294 [Pseudobdellovibrio exovorus JSS]
MWKLYTVIRIIKNMNLDGIDVFVKVVQMGSFTAAAKALQMPVTTVSGKVAALEKRLGSTLLHRTTRQLNLTQAGEVFFNHCVKALDEITSAENELSLVRTEPEGLLRITTVNDMGHNLLPPLIRSYLKAYPKMSVELVLTGRLVDLARENVDLAIRAGPLKDSQLITKKFFTSRLSLWASAGYVKKHGLPQKIQDLSQHQFIQFSRMSSPLKLVRGGKTVEVPFQTRVIADDMNAIKSFILHGEGIGVLPSFVCEPEASAGKLIPVLDEWMQSEIQVSFVYLPQRFISLKVQSFIDWLQKHRPETCLQSRS